MPNAKCQMPNAKCQIISAPLSNPVGTPVLGCPDTAGAVSLHPPRNQKKARIVCVPPSSPRTSD